MTLAARLGQFAVCVILLFAALALVAAFVAQAQRRRRDRARIANRSPQWMTTSSVGCAWQPPTFDAEEPQVLREYRLSDGP